MKQSNLMTDKNNFIMNKWKKKKKLKVLNKVLTMYEIN